jgi:hypothetical protein
MNRPLTTVERLQQQQSLRVQTTTSSLKRNVRGYPLTDLSGNVDTHHIETEHNSAYPRKRKDFAIGKGAYGRENEGGAEHWRIESTEGYPTPSPSVSGISSQSRSRPRVESAVQQVVTELNLVYSRLWS